MNKKNGYIMSTYVYILLVFFLLLLVVILMLMNNTKLLTNKIKTNPERLSEILGYTFTLNGGEYINTYVGETYTDQGFTIVGRNGDDLSNYVTTSGSVNTNEIGIYEINYVVTYGGKTTTFTRNVAVIGKELVFKRNTSGYTIFIAPMTGYYKVELWGAQGGNALLNAATGGKGGKGAYTSGYIYLTQNDKLYMYVGGKGGDGTTALTAATAGYNGGGTGDHDNSDNEVAGGGGGATDIRYFGSTIPSSSDLAWNSTLGLNSRIMVAAGGGGGNDSKAGLPGGTLTNSKINAEGYTAPLYTQTTQTTGYSFGIGENGTRSTTNYPPSGGGGGYYGGYSQQSSSEYFLLGGGGSSYISGYAGVNSITSSTSRTHTNNTKHYNNKYFINGRMVEGIKEGDGKAKITFISKTLPTRTKTSLNNVRYVKDCINGSSANTSNHWVELQAIQNGVNLAKGKTVTTTASVTNSTTHATTYLVDGIIDNTTGTSGYVDTATGAGNQCVTVDLGAAYNLDEIAVWHYYLDGRTYNSNVTSVSSNNSTWTTVMNTTAAETANGKRVSAWD